MYVIISTGLAKKPVLETLQEVIRAALMQYNCGKRRCLTASFLPGKGIQKDNFTIKNPFYSK